MNTLIFKKQSGITGIEMILIVAVIAILASFSFPAFQKARERVKRVTCMSNLKQYGEAFMIYQSNYGRIPQSFDGTDDWYDILSDDNIIKTNFGFEDVNEGLYCPTFVNNFGQPSGAGADYSTYCMPTISEDVSLDMLGNANGYSNTFLLSERGEADGTEGWALASETEFAQHTLGSNYLFIDGHVEFLSQSEAQSANFCWPNTQLNNFC